MVSEKDNFGGTHMEGASGCSPENIASVRRLDWYWTNVLKKEQVSVVSRRAYPARIHKLQRQRQTSP